MKNINIKINWSAAECEPWETKMQIVDINDGKLIVKNTDSRLGGKTIEIPTDDDSYKDDHIVIYHGDEIIAYVKKEEMERVKMPALKLYLMRNCKIKF